MVQLEWQNAIMRESKHNVLFVPIKMTNVEVPAIITQKLYLDMYHNGIDMTLRQMVDLVRNGRLTPEEYKPYENIVGYALMEDNQDSKKIHFYVYAQTFYEPICRFLILANVKQNEANLELSGGGMFSTNYYPNAKELPNGDSLNGFYIGKDTGMTPGFVNHLIFTITGENYKSPAIDLMREVKDQEFRGIPITQIRDVDELPK